MRAESSFARRGLRLPHLKASEWGCYVDINRNIIPNAVRTVVRHVSHVVVISLWVSDSTFCHLFSEFYCKIRPHFSKNLRLAPKFSNPAKAKIGAVFRWKNHCFCNTLLYRCLQSCCPLSLLERAGSGLPWRPPGSATGPLLHCNGAAVATWRRARCDLAGALRLVADRFFARKRLSETREILCFERAGRPSRGENGIKMIIIRAQNWHEKHSKCPILASERRKPEDFSNVIL